MRDDKYQTENKEKLWPEHVRVVEKNYSIDDAVMDRMCVELIEDEIDRELERELDEDLKSWLSHSDGGAEEMEKLSQLRQILKKSDDVPMPESGAYYDGLESRIMASLNECIEAGDVTEHGPNQNKSNQESFRFSSEKTKGTRAEALVTPERRRSVTMRAGQFAILAGLALLSTGKWLAAPTSGAQQTKDSKSTTVAGSAASELRATREAAPKVLTSTVISFESDADLALEIAARRLVAYHKGE